MAKLTKKQIRDNAVLFNNASEAYEKGSKKKLPLDTVCIPLKDGDKFYIVFAKDLVSAPFACVQIVGIFGECKLLKTVPKKIKDSMEILRKERSKRDKIIEKLLVKIKEPWMRTDLIKRYDKMPTEILEMQLKASKAWKTTKSKDGKVISNSINFSDFLKAIK